MTRMSEEEKLKRRLSAYPGEMWDVLKAAVGGQAYHKTFAEHHQAVSFIARFYKFRLDAIQAGVVGALAMREMTASGRDSLGGLLSTRGPGGGGPYTVMWSHSGLMLKDMAPMEQATQKAVDETEAMLGDLLSERSEAKELTAEELAEHERLRALAGSELPADLEQAVCEHEVDSTGTFCLKCRKPM